MTRRPNHKKITSPLRRQRKVGARDQLRFAQGAKSSHPRWFVGLVGFVTALVIAGCIEKPQSGISAASQGSGAANNPDVRRADELFESSVRSLQELNSLANLSRYRDVNEIEVLSTQLKDWLQTRQPPTAWEPDPTVSVLAKITNRLSGWVKVHAEDIPWAPDPLIATLPEPLRAIPEMQRLDALDFSDQDGHDLREALWMNQISSGLVADTKGDLAAATAMFDWVIRNVQLEGPGPLDATADQKAPSMRRLPWQVVLYGAGTAEERAWVFVNLARQQGLRVVMLALPTGDASELRPWLPALVYEGDLYLFDTQLGLPIPGPGGEGIATLAQASADDSVLRHLDLSDQRKYPVKAADLGGVTVWIEASPAYLSRRMATLESALSAKDKLVLSGQPTAWAEQVKSLPQVGKVALWPLPQQTFADAATLPMPGRNAAVKDFMAMITLPELWKGRVLHWRRNFAEQDANAVAFYYRAMPSEKELAQLPEDRPDLREYSLRAKQNATYWLGLLQVDRGDPASAVQYFQRLTLDQWPDGPWTSGARYNLARVYEALGEPAKAAALYAADVSPQFHGNRLRGKWLAEKQGRP